MDACRQNDREIQLRKVLVKCFADNRKQCDKMEMFI